jgi:pimeloyl-ACP methyl ester carboxylesterase
MMTSYDRDPDSRYAAVDGVRVHYKRAGHGPAVVLLHGSGSSVHGFERVAEMLSASFHVIRLDLPGFGLTGPRPDRDYHVTTYAATVARFMAELAVPHYAVVGNSLGGNIAWNLALDQPDRVDRLVLVNATGYPEKSLPAGLRLARNPLLRPLLRRWLPRRATERNLRAAVGPQSTIVDDAMVDRVHAMMSRPGNRSAFVDFAMTDQPDRSSLIKRISVPTLVLRSAAIDGQHFARDIPGSIELVNADGGHLLPEEDPEWVAVAVQAFLHTGGGQS